MTMKRHPFDISDFKMHQGYDMLLEIYRTRSPNFDSISDASLRDLLSRML